MNLYLYFFRPLNSWHSSVTFIFLKKPFISMFFCFHPFGTPPWHDVSIGTDILPCQLDHLDFLKTWPWPSSFTFNLHLPVGETGLWVFSFEGHLQCLCCSSDMLPVGGVGVDLRVLGWFAVTWFSLPTLMSPISILRLTTDHIHQLHSSFAWVIFFMSDYFCLLWRIKTIIRQLLDLLTDCWWCPAVASIPGRIAETTTVE